jgi:hypothetical protein
LINGQFIVRDDGVYLLEVNPAPRAPVPFMSRRQAYQMVTRRTRIALGETLARPRAGPADCCTRSLVAVKAPVFSTAAARRGSDARPGNAIDRRGDRHPRRRAWPWRRHLRRLRCAPVVGEPKPAHWPLLSIADRDKD